MEEHRATSRSPFRGAQEQEPSELDEGHRVDESVEADEGTEMTVGNKTAEDLDVIMNDVGHPLPRDRVVRVTLPGRMVPNDTRRQLFVLRYEYRI
jgi:hypothetical protein